MSISEFVSLGLVASSIIAALLFAAIINTVIHSIICRYVYERRDFLYDVSSVGMFGIFLYVCISYGPRLYYYLLQCGQIPF